MCSVDQGSDCVVFSFCFCLISVLLGITIKEMFVPGKRYNRKSLPNLLHKWFIADAYQQINKTLVVVVVVVVVVF